MNTKPVVPTKELALFSVTYSAVSQKKNIE